MVIVKPHQTAVSLFHKSGSVRVFASLAQVKKELGVRWISNNVGAHFREYVHSLHKISYHLQAEVCLREPLYKECDYIMRNDVGEPVTAADFDVFKTRSKRSLLWERRYLWNGEGPVPRIRKWRGGHHYRRRIKVAHSLRQSFALFEEGEVAPRPSQGYAGLPDPWDDYGVAPREDRNWKRFRKIQYKAE